MYAEYNECFRLIVGDDVIFQIGKDLTLSKLVNTFTKIMKRYSTVKEVMSEIQKRLNKVILLIGNHDIRSSSFTVDKFKDQYNQLLKLISGVCKATKIVTCQLMPTLEMEMKQSFRFNIQRTDD